MEKNIRQKDENVNVRVDQIKHDVEEELRNMQVLTKTSLGENIDSINDKIRTEIIEMDIKMKSLDVKIEQNFEKNMENSNKVAQTVQELSKSQVENLLSLKSEISNKIDETDHYNKSLISNIEERLVTDTENKIAQLGKSL